MQSMKKTGGGPYDQKTLTEEEEKIVQLTSLRKAVSGSNAKIFGAPEQNQVTNQSTEDLENDVENLLDNVLESPKKHSEADILSTGRKR